MSKIEVNTIDTIAGSTTLTLGSTNATLITLDSGAQFSNVSGQNYPAFEAYLSANIVVTNNVVAKIPINTEVFDTNGYYDNTTNYRFTPLVAGKYMVYASAYGFADLANNLESVRIYIHKNGSIYRGTYFSNTTNGSYSKTPYVHAMIDMNGSTDYLELFGLVDSSSGTPAVDGGSFARTYFGAYRIGS